MIFHKLKSEFQIESFELILRSECFDERDIILYIIYHSMKINL